MNGHALFRMAETAANRSRGGGGLIKATFLDAAAAYRTARELGGDPFSCAYFEAESLFWGEATARALEVVEVALGRDPESTAAALLKGRILLAAARPAEAAEVLAAARSRAQADPDLAYLLLRAVLDTGDRQRARDSFLELLETFPEDRELYDCFYVHFEGLQPGSFLQETLEEALRRRPPERDRFPLWYLGVLAESQGRLEEALARYTEYRDLRPTTPESDFQRGTVLTRMGRLEEARQALLRANALGGIPADQMAEGLRWLVAAQVQRQDFEAAARLQQVVFSLSLAAEDELNLGVLEFNAGRQEEGVRLYRRLLAREDLAPSMGAQAENYLGLALLGMGNATDAEAAFRRSIARDEAHLDALENLGALLVNQGRRGEAVPFLTRVLEEDGARQRSRYHLMRARHPHRVEALTERDR